MTKTTRLQDALFRNSSNTSRYNYLHNLLTWGNAHKDEQLRADLASFVRETRPLLFLGIAPPVTAEVELLINEASVLSRIQDTWVVIPLLRQPLDDAHLSGFYLNSCKWGAPSF
jgi:hypothetical protein